MVASTVNEREMGFAATQNGELSRRLSEKRTELVLGRQGWPCLNYKASTKPETYIK